MVSSRRTACGVASTPRESAIIIAAKAAAQAGRKRASLGAWPGTLGEFYKVVPWCWGLAELVYKPYNVVPPR